MEMTQEMVTLFCLVVGERGCAFAVDVDENKSVDHVKDAIAAKQKYDFAASKLQLFLAKELRKEDAKWVEAVTEDLQTGKRTGVWLQSLSNDVRQLKRGVSTAAVEELTRQERELQGESGLANVFKSMAVPSMDQIHVLVVHWEAIADGVAAIDTPARKRTALAKLLTQCKAQGDLPPDGEFLDLFQWTDADCGTIKDISSIQNIVRFTGDQFYVRKEVLCVLANFLTIYQEELATGDRVNQQFILMGSPGTGKSCILALICFYMAIKKARPIVWFRQVAGDSDLASIWLLYKGKWYEWEDTKTGVMYTDLFDVLRGTREQPNRCWFVLDGMGSTEVTRRGWFNMFNLLACSSAFYVKNEANSLQTTCLVPCWRQQDLDDLASKLKKSESEGTTARASALTPGGTSTDGDTVLGSDGLSSNKDADFPCAPGVKDVTNPLHYIHPRCWT